MVLQYNTFGVRLLWNEYALLEEKLNRKINSMFNKSYVEILEDQDSFIKEYCNVFSESDDIEDKAYEYLEWYVDNRASTTAEISTGKCLVYEDMNYTILRASIDLRVLGEKNAAATLSELLNIDISENAATLICECYFFPNSDELVGFTLCNLGGESE